MTPLQAEALLNPFCTRAHLQVIYITPSTYRASRAVITVLSFLAKAPFSFVGCRSCHGDLAIFRMYRRGRSMAGYSACSYQMDQFHSSLKGTGCGLGRLFSASGVHVRWVTGRSVYRVLPLDYFILIYAGKPVECFCLRRDSC